MRATRTIPRLVATLAGIILVGLCVRGALADERGTQDPRTSVVYLESGATIGDSWVVFGTQTAFFVGVPGTDPSYLVTVDDFKDTFERYGKGDLRSARGPSGGMVNGRVSLRAYVDGDTWREAYVVEADDIRGLALLRLDEPCTTRLPLTLRVPDDSLVGESVRTVGFASLLSPGYHEQSMSDEQENARLYLGVVSKLMTVSASGVRLAMIDAPMGETNAGGPVVDASGNLCCVFDKTSEEGSDKFSVGISAVEVQDLLRRNGVDFSEASATGDDVETSPAESYGPEGDEVTTHHEDAASDTSGEPAWTERVLPVAVAVFLLLAAILVAVTLVQRARRRDPSD